MLLDGQRRRSHGHARQARPAPSHNPGEACRAEKKKASSNTCPWQLRATEWKQEVAQLDPLRTSDNVWDPWATLVCLFIQPAAQRPGSGLACRPPLPAVARNRRLLARNLELAVLADDGLFGDDSTARAFNASSSASRLVHIYACP